MTDKGAVIFYQRGSGKTLGQETDRVIGKGMPLEIIDKETRLGMISHPLQHLHQFLIREMMTEQRGKNNIGFYLLEIHRTVVGEEQGGICAGQFFAGDGDTMRIIIDPREFHRDALSVAVPENGRQIIAAAATDLTYADLFLIFQ